MSFRIIRSSVLIYTSFVSAVLWAVSCSAATIVDDLNDFTKMWTRSPGLQFDLSNSNLFNDPSRLVRTSTAASPAEYIVYSANGLQQLSFPTYFNQSEEAIIDFKVYASPDGSNWTQVTAITFNNTLIVSNTWTKRDYSITSFPTGSNYVKIEFKTSGLHSYAPALGQVTITYNPTQSGGYSSIFQDVTGNIGIGSVTPSAKLSVIGVSSSRNDTGILQISTGTGATADNKLVIGVNDAGYSWMQAVKPGSAYKDLVINPGGGNLGIGSTSPAAKLDVGGSINIASGQWLTYGAGVGGAATDSGIDFGSGSQITRRSVDGHMRYNSQNNVHEFVGKVGIGTTTPLSPLHVIGNIAIGSSTAPATWTSNGSDIFLNTGISSSGIHLRPNGSASGFGQYELFGGGVHNFYDSSGNIQVNFNNGNVGIGTTTAHEKLEVNGNVLITGTIRFPNASNNQMSFQNNGGNLSLSTTNAANTSTQSVATFYTDGSAAFGGKMSAAGFNAGGQKVQNVAEPIAANDAATKNYVDLNNALTSVGPNVSLRNPGNWIAFGSSTPLAPLYVENSSPSGEVARFSPGGVYRNLALRSYVTLKNQNPDYWWEFSVQDETDGGTRNGFALRSKDPGVGVTIPRLYFNPGTPLNGASTDRSFMRLYNLNPSNGWEFSVQDPMGTGTVNGFALREFASGTSSAPRLYIANDSGNIGIGTAVPGSYKLAVNGTIHTRGVVVDQAGWADYVFAPDYKPMPLAQVEKRIKTEGHLPGVPSAAEVAEKGVNLGDMQAVLLAKIEELTLHLIEQEKRFEKLKLQLAEQEKRFEKMELENAALRAR